MPGRKYTLRVYRFFFSFLYLQFISLLIYFLSVFIDFAVFEIFLCMFVYVDGHPEDAKVSVIATCRLKHLHLNDV